MMHTIKETCSCGATLELSLSGWYSDINLQRAAKDFREAHKICREKKETYLGADRK